MTLARQWQEEGAEALHVVDLDAARTGELTNFGIVERIVRTVECRSNTAAASAAPRASRWWPDRRALGVMGTAAVTALNLLDDAVNWLGQRLVVGLDCTDGMSPRTAGGSVRR